MASLQDALSTKQDALRRHLFDKQILLTGRQFDAIRVTREQEDAYGDVFEGSELIDFNETITLSINYPSEIPLNRFKYTSGDTAEERQTVVGTGTFFFDVLPIEVFSRFEDKLETDDYIIHSLKDEVGNKIVIVLIATEQLGTLGGSLTWRKHLCAPFNGKLSEVLQTAVDTLLEED